MSKPRGCFITIVVILTITAAVFLFVFFVSSGSGDNDILLLGIDEREENNEFEGLTDTIIIYHMGSRGSESYLISIPRDVRVNLEGHGWNKINAAYKYGGKEMIEEEVFKLTDISIDKVVLVNFRGFKEIIDILGGVEITVDEALHDPLSGADFDPGTYLMDGEEALSFVRCRATAGVDLDRVDRQKYLLSEIIKQKFNFSIIYNSPRIIDVLNERTKSDLTLLDYCSLGFRILLSNKDVNWLTIPVEPAYIDGISYLITDKNEVVDFLDDYLK